MQNINYKPHNKIFHIIALVVLITLSVETCLQAAPLDNLKSVRDAESGIEAQLLQGSISSADIASERRTSKQWAYFYDKLYAMGSKVVGEQDMGVYERRFRKIDRMRLVAEEATTKEESVIIYRQAQAKLETLSADIQLTESSDFTKKGYYSKATVWLRAMRPKLNKQERRWLLAECL